MLINRIAAVVFPHEPSSLRSATQDQVVTEEKIQALIAAGVDQRSIAVTRWKLDREVEKMSGPVTFGRPGVGRVQIHR
jgi:hypothetical protein